MLRRRLLLGVFVGLPLLGCSPTARSVEAEADEQAIQAVRERLMTAFTAGAVDSILAVLASDAIMMPPEEPALTGAEAIRPWLQNIAAHVSVEGRYTDAQVNVTGDWAIERYAGSLRLTPKVGGVTTEQRIKGIHIYRRQADGSWRISKDIWNANAPPPSTPAAE
jgi:uncharacterized protein (TIGR02246 family)